MKNGTRMTRMEQINADSNINPRSSAFICVICVPLLVLASRPAGLGLAVVGQVGGAQAGDKLGVLGRLGRGEVVV